MQNMARNVFAKHLKKNSWQRLLSTSSVLKNNNEFIIKSDYPDIVLPNMRFLDRMWMESKRFQNHVALECAETKKSYTYQKLQKNIAVFATSLHRKLDLKVGDTVCVMLPNTPEFVVVAFGTLQAGCVLTTMNPIYKEGEIAHQINLTEPKVIVTATEYLNVVQKGLNKAKANVKIVVVDTPSKAIPSGTIRLSELAENGDADYALLDKIERKRDDIAVIPFSSGTTGLPKGVEITHGNLSAAFESMDHEAYSFPKIATETFQDVIPCILPFYHIYGLVVTLVGHLCKGCKLVTFPKFSVTTYLDVLKNQKATLLYVVPPVAILLSKHPDVTSQHLSHVRHILCGAAPLSASDAEGILKKSQKNIEFGQGFGATETTSITTSTPIGHQVDFAATGVPMSGVELMFLDPLNGKPVQIGETGELCVRSQTVMKGYHKNEKETKDSMTDDGFFKTGDLGHYKPGVGLYITDRIKELIKVKGLQVAPAELEGILRSHPSVADAAVIGIPHDFFGEVPKAFIIRKAGQSASEEELKSFVADKVAAFKKIEYVTFVDDIPKTTSGKILRRELKKIYA